MTDTQVQGFLTVAEWNNGHTGEDDPKRCEETLFLNKGTWFIAGKGGSESKYANVNGERVTVLGKNEAYGWLRDRDFTEAIQKYFPDKV